jgi:hypothetical protein
MIGLSAAGRTVSVRPPVELLVDGLGGERELPAADVRQPVGQLGLVEQRRGGAAAAPGAELPQLALEDAGDLVGAAAAGRLDAVARLGVGHPGLLEVAAHRELVGAEVIDLDLGGGLLDGEVALGERARLDRGAHRRIAGAGHPGRDQQHEQRARRGRLRVEQVPRRQRRRADRAEHHRGDDGDARERLADQVELVEHVRDRGDDQHADRLQPALPGLFEPEAERGGAFDRLVRGGVEVVGFRALLAAGHVGRGIYHRKEPCPPWRIASSFGAVSDGEAVVFGT